MEAFHSQQFVMTLIYEYFCDFILPPEEVCMFFIPRAYMKMTKVIRGQILNIFNIFVSISLSSVNISFILSNNSLKFRTWTVYIVIIYGTTLYTLYF